MKILTGLAMVFLLAGIGFGHPAESIKMNFDSTGTILTVVVTHPVKTPTNHYISSITVDINGKEKVKQTFSRQLDNSDQIAIYKLIDAKKDDKINVTTQCNITGKKKETIIYTFVK